MKCLNCEKETRNPKFCSSSCCATYYNKISPKRKPEGKCKTCGKIISTKYKYCSALCKEKDKKLEIQNRIIKKAQTKKEKKGNSKNVISYRKRTKIKAVEYKGGKCIRCGYNKCVNALAFHHIDPKTKEIRISSGNTIAYEKLIKELDKCVLLCLNCHAEVHAEIEENK